MTTLDRLCAILAKDYKLDAKTLTPEASLEALGIDSLGVAELLFNVEDEFKVKLPPDRVELPTVADVVRYIDGLISAQHVATATTNDAVAPEDSSPAA